MASHSTWSSMSPGSFTRQQVGDWRICDATLSEYCVQAITQPARPGTWHQRIGGQPNATESAHLWRHGRRRSLLLCGSCPHLALRQLPELHRACAGAPPCRLLGPAHTPPVKIHGSPAQPEATGRERAHRGSLAGGAAISPAAGPTARFRLAVVCFHRFSVAPAVRPVPRAAALCAQFPSP